MTGRESVKNRIFSLVFILLAGSLLLTACSPRAPSVSSTPSPITIIDSTGRTVTLQAPPQRIVIAGRAVALIADAAYLFPDALQRIVAVSGTNQGSGDFLELVDPMFAQRIAFDTNAGPEQVAAARPDLVLMKTYMAETLGRPLETLGIPVVYLDLETPEQYQRDLRILGQVFQDEARAEELAGYYQQEVDQVAAAVANTPQKQRPRVLLLYYSNRDGQIAFNVPPASWMQTILTQLGGGVPARTDIQLGSGWNIVNLEQIAAWDADQIFIISYATDPEEVVAGLFADTQWQAMRAVQNGHLHAFPKDYYSWDQPDPRWILGLRWLAWRLHPEQFEDVDIQAAARTFFAQWYGIDEEAFDQSIQPRLRGDFE